MSNLNYLNQKHVFGNVCWVIGLKFEMFLLIRDVLNQKAFFEEKKTPHNSTYWLHNWVKTQK